MKVLVVDHELSTLEVFQAIFSDLLAIKALCHQKAISAIESLLQHEDISLIICDYHLPHHESEQLYQFNLKNRNLPFFYLSTLSEKEIDKMGLNKKDHYLNDHLSKPFDVHEMVEKLQKIVSLPFFRFPDLMGLRYLNSQNEIERLFLLADQEQVEFDIWQNEKKNSLKAHVRSVKIQNSKPTITFQFNTQPRETLNAQIACYFRCAKLNMLFSALGVNHYQSLVIVDLPEKIMMRINRRNSRLFFSPESKKMPKAYFTFKDKMMDLPVLDLSASGIAINIPAALAKSFQKGDEWQFHKIDAHMDLQNTMGKIIYIRNFTAKNGPISFRAGIEFKNPLKTEQLFEILPQSD